MNFEIIVMNYSYFTFAILLTLAGHFFRINRFQLLINDRKFSKELHYKSLAIGYIANVLFPIRLGELIRSLILSGFNSKNFISALSAIIVERALDGGVIAVFALSMFLGTKNGTEGLKTIFMPYAAIIFILLILLILIISRPNKLKLWLFMVISKFPKLVSLNVFRVFFRIIHITINFIITRY